VRSKNYSALQWLGGTFIAMALVFGSTPLAQAAEATRVLDSKFANCSALNKLYPGGVAKNKKVQNRGGETKETPAVKPNIYKLNSSKDRDKDGIACER
jgi:hypothetical protein